MISVTGSSGQMLFACYTVLFFVTKNIRWTVLNSGCVCIMQ